jgi:hypothetical protein
VELSVGIALLALVVSIAVALWQARVAREQTRIAREQTDIQARLAAIEEARRAEEVEARSLAQVTASFQPHGPDSRLVVHNQGPAIARDVEVEVEQGLRIPPVFSLDALPADLQPGQQRTFQAPVAPLGDAATMRVMVRWTDGAGDHEEWFTLQTHQ